MKNVLKTWGKPFFVIFLLLAVVYAFYPFTSVPQTSDKQHIAHDETDLDVVPQNAAKHQGQLASDRKIIYQVFSGGRVDKGSSTSISGRLVEMQSQTFHGKAFWYLDAPEVYADGESVAKKGFEDLKTIAKSGAVVQLGDNRQLHRILGADFWQHLLTKIQVNLLEDKYQTARQWIRSEKTAYGMVDTQYEQVNIDKTSNVLTFEKNHRFRPQPQMEVALNCQGVWDLVESVISKLDCKELLDFSSSKGQTQIVNEISLKLQTLLPLNASDFERMKKMLSHSKRLRDMPKKYEAQMKLLDGKGLDEVFHLVDQAGENERDADAYLNLKAWIYVNQDKLEEIYEQLTHLPRNDPKFRLGLRALMGVGSKESQLILTKLLDDSLSGDKTKSQSVIGAMALVKRPSLESEQRLKELSKTHEDALIRKSTTLALGAMGQKLSQGDPSEQGRYKKILGDFTSQLQNAKTPAELLDVISALGNIGTAEALELLTPYTKSENPDVASVALFSLRLIASQSARDLLFSARTRPQALVRMKAAKALSFQQLSAEELKLLGVWLLEDKDLLVRRQLFTNISDHIKKQPDLVTELISKAIEFEQDSYMKAQMTKLISSS